MVEITDETNETPVLTNDLPEGGKTYGDNENVNLECPALKTVREINFILKMEVKENDYV